MKIIIIIIIIDITKNDDHFVIKSLSSLYALCASAGHSNEMTHPNDLIRQTERKNLLTICVHSVGCPHYLIIGHFDRYRHRKCCLQILFIEKASGFLFKMAFHVVCGLVSISGELGTNKHVTRVVETSYETRQGDIKYSFSNFHYGRFSRGFPCILCGHKKAHQTFHFQVTIYCKIRGFRNLVTGKSTFTHTHTHLVEMSSSSYTRNGNNNNKKKPHQPSTM
jgi:hypothetical protein